MLDDLRHPALVGGHAGQVARLPVVDADLGLILMEETIPRRKQRRKDTPEEARYRKSVRTDIRRMKKAGPEVVIPTLQPDPTE